MKILIKNGHVIDPANNIDGEQDILVEGSKIKAVSFNKMGEDLQKVTVSRNELIKEIAEREQIEEALRHAYDRLEKTQEQLIQAEKLNAVGQLASGVAHEVRNPLAIIVQGVEYLEKIMPSGENSADSAETILMIKDSVRRADKIVNLLLDFSRAGSLELNPENINLILENSLLLVQTKIKFENIELKTELKKDIPKIWLDKHRMEQVFINLFLNAIQSMPKGGSLTIRTYDKILDETKSDIIDKAEASHFRIGELVIIVEIEDTGIGIPEEHLSKIFDPFFTTKGPKEGAGLGLSVTKNIISTHNGSIRVTSQLQKGTKVIIALKSEGGVQNA